MDDDAGGRAVVADGFVATATPQPTGDVAAIMPKALPAPVLTRAPSSVSYRHVVEPVSMTRPSVLLILLVSACASDKGSSGCPIGTIETCLCTDGSEASRVCTDDRVWSPCTCREPVDVQAPPTDTRGTRDDAEADATPDVPADVTPDLTDVAPDAAGPEPAADAATPEPIADVPAVDLPPEPFEVHYPDNCQPDCGARVCGPDGCGGTCGACDCGHECQQGACVWIACEGRACGDSGCPGVSCGGCYGFRNSACVETFGGSTCECPADCTDRQCGDNGCGGSCGICQPGLVCTPSGKCMQGCDNPPSCGACGNIPCVNASGLHSCGTCLEGTHCSADGMCVACLSSADCAPPLVCLAMTCVPVVAP